MGSAVKNSRVCVLVWSRGHRFQGLEVPLERGVTFRNVDVLNYSVLDAELIAMEYARCPNLYEQNVADVLHCAVRRIERWEEGTFV